ncbi:hypothetical protein RLH21_10410, partial [Streptococcus pneumoniae]|nr:hypothetical protein [Streptococcus pneumoniae]MDS8126478.1 hypothetical protein [Streptococcus pneumoniae]
FLSSKKHPLGEKRNHPGSKLRQGFWMVFRLGVNNWGKENFFMRKRIILSVLTPAIMRFL